MEINQNTCFEFLGLFFQMLDLINSKVVFKNRNK